MCKKLTVDYTEIFLEIASVLLIGAFFLFGHFLFQLSLPEKLFPLYFDFWRGWSFVGGVEKLFQFGYFGVGIFFVNNFLLFSISDKLLRKIALVFTFLIELVLLVAEIYLYFLQVKI